MIQHHFSDHQQVVDIGKAVTAHAPSKWPWSMQTSPGECMRRGSDVQRPMESQILSLNRYKLDDNSCN